MARSLRRRDRPNRHGIDLDDARFANVAFPIRDGAVAQLEISGAAPADATLREETSRLAAPPSISPGRRCSTSNVIDITNISRSYCFLPIALPMPEHPMAASDRTAR